MVPGSPGVRQLPQSWVTHPDAMCATFLPLTSHHIEVLALSMLPTAFEKRLQAWRVFLPQTHQCVCDTVALGITFPSLPSGDDILHHSGAFYLSFYCHRSPPILRQPVRVPLALSKL